MSKHTLSAALFVTALLIGGASASPDPLAGIRIEPEHDDDLYQRVQWMPGGTWADADGDCQDGRQEDLIAQSTVKPTLTNDSCSVVSRWWVDRYTGEVATDPSTIEIDHLVALKEAHDSGGFAWLREGKQALAQDVTGGNVWAVMTSTSRSKGDRDPGEWLPANKDRACWYVRRWIEVKRRWSLLMDQAEADAARRLLA